MQGEELAHCALIQQEIVEAETETEEVELKRSGYKFKSI